MEIANFLIPVITAVVVWCVVKPQAVENKVLHKAIDNNTAALDRLTEVVNDIKHELGRYDERIRVLEREMKRLNTDISITGKEVCMV